MANQKSNQNKNKKAGNNRPNSQNQKPQNSNRSASAASASKPTATAPIAPRPNPTVLPKPTATATRPVASGGDKKLTPKQQAALKRQATRRRNQYIAIGLIALVTIGAIGLIIAVLNQPTKFELSNTVLADNAAARIPDKTSVDERFTMGASDAPITVTEYGDFQCPACRQFEETNGGNFKNDYVKTGKVKFVFQTWAFLDQNSAYKESHVAAEAAYCAADQKRFWDFHNALYTNQLPENTGKLTADRMKQMAAQLQLNPGDFNKCLDSGKYRQTVNDDATKVIQKGVTATPSFAIDGQLVTAGGKASPGTINSYDDLKAAVDKALAAKK